MIVTIIGLGLIGGSLAIDIRKQKIATKIIGVDRSTKNADDALSLGLVDEIASFNKAISNADLIIIATPVGSFEKIFSELKPYWSKQAIYSPEIPINPRFFIITNPKIQL